MDKLKGKYVDMTQLIHQVIPSICISFHFHRSSCFISAVDKVFCRFLLVLLSGEKNRLICDGNCDGWIHHFITAHINKLHFLFIRLNTLDHSTASI